MRRIWVLMMLAVAALGLAAPVAAEGTAKAAAQHLAIGITGTDRFRDVGRRVEPFRAHLAEKLKIDVTVTPFRDGNGLIDALTTGRVDYAVLSASAYAQAARACACVEPLAVPRGADGQTAWRSLLLVRADSPARGLEDLKGLVLAAAPPRSFAARTHPLAALEVEGRAGTVAGFARIDTVAGPMEAVKALVDRKADAALAWTPHDGDEGAPKTGPLALMEARKLVDPAAYRILFASQPVPNGPHAVRASLPPELRARLRDLLVGLKEAAPDAYEAVEPEFGGGFVPVAADAFDALIKVLAAK